MSREFEAYVRRIVRRPDMGPRSTTNRRAVPLDGQGAGEPAQVVGSSPQVVANAFTGFPDGNFVDGGRGTVSTNIVSWRGLVPHRSLGFERFSETGLRAELTDKGEPVMQYRIIIYGGS